MDYVPGLGRDISTVETVPMPGKPDLYFLSPSTINFKFLDRNLSELKKQPFWNSHQLYN